MKFLLLQEKPTIMKAECKWKSEKTRHYKCNRNTYAESEYCLFHKPDKTSDEAEIFWKVINWQPYLGFTAEEIQNILNKSILLASEEIKYYYGQKYSNAISLNYSQEENNRADFEEYKKNVENELQNSQINEGIHGNYNFNGFVFPITTSNSIFQFNHNQNKTFNGFGVLDFSEAIFQCSIFFDNYVFDRPVFFDDCQFNQMVGFYNTKFLKDVSFSNTTFSNVHRAGIHEFQDTVFKGNIVKFEKTNIEFTGAIFGDYTRLELKNMTYSTLSGVAEWGSNSYKIAKIHANRIGDFDKSAEYYYHEKCYLGYQILPEVYFWDKYQKGIKKIAFLEYLMSNYKKIIPKLMDLIMRHSIGYGEKPINALVSTILIIFAFAFLSLFTGININGNEINYNLYIGKDIFNITIWKNNLVDFGNSLYFSMVTFTTVGYGDITPTVGWGKWISGIEMFLGVTFIGAWTATLLRKFMR